VWIDHVAVEMKYNTVGWSGVACSMPDCFKYTNYLYPDLLVINRITGQYLSMF